MLATQRSPIRSDPAITGGTPVFRATRIPAWTLAIVELPTDRRPVLDRSTAEILAAVAASSPGSCTRVDGVELNH